MSKINYPGVFLSTVILSGCAGLISQPADDVPVEEPGKSETRVPGNPDLTSTDINNEFIGLESMQAELYQQSPPSASPQPVIVALLDDARQQQQQGRLMNAAATIERAIRLEPNNPVLWTRLAQIRLAEKNWQQAYVLANKSNSLARTNTQLQRLNWGIIEQAKTSQGDMAAAENARTRIRILMED